MENDYSLNNLALERRYLRAHSLRGLELQLSHKKMSRFLIMEPMLE